MTKKQRECLEAINDFIIKNKYSPSFEELKDIMKVKSKTNIVNYVNSLERQGFVKRIPYTSRTLEVIRMH